MYLLIIKAARIRRMQGDDHGIEELHDEDFGVEGIASLKPTNKNKSTAPKKKDWSLMGGDELDDFNLDLSSDSESDSEPDDSSASDLGSDSGDDSDESIENKKGKKRPSEAEPQGNYE